MLKTKGVFLEGRMGRMRNKRPRKLMEVKYFLKIIIKEKEKKTRSEFRMQSEKNKTREQGRKIDSKKFAKKEIKVEKRRE